MSPEDVPRGRVTLTAFFLAMVLPQFPWRTETIAADP